MTNDTWSDWLDFSEDEISKAPCRAGVFMMHAAMKILYIGGSPNMRESLRQHFSHTCISDATRYRFRETDSFEEEKMSLIKEYQQRHEGKLPRCMESV